MDSGASTRASSQQQPDRLLPVRTRPITMSGTLIPVSTLIANPHSLWSAVAGSNLECIRMCTCSVTEKTEYWKEWCFLLVCVPPFYPSLMHTFMITHAHTHTPTHTRTHTHTHTHAHTHTLHVLLPPMPSGHFLLGVRGSEAACCSQPYRHFYPRSICSHASSISRRNGECPSLVAAVVGWRL